MRRPTAAARAQHEPEGAVLHLAPSADPLPDWHVRIPRGGWTTASAYTAAQDYADGRSDERAATARAYVALLRAVPGLHRADVVERLRGVDELRVPDLVAGQADGAPF